MRWNAAHNSYLQVGAELGAVGLALFVAVIVSALVALHRSRPPADAGEGPRDRRLQLTQVLTASLIGFVVGAFFLSLAYSDMLYTLIAMAVGMRKAMAAPSAEEHGRHPGREAAAAVGAMTGSLGVAGMRIAHLIESDGPGGAERFLAHLASALQAAGASNLAILPADGEGWLERELQASGVAIEHFRLDRPVSPDCARGLEATLRRHRIDVAHSHEFTMAVYGGWACWRVGIPQIVTMHGSLYYAERVRRRVALRAALALRGRTVAVSESLARRLREDLWMPASRVTMIPNGVPCPAARVPTLREELGLGPADPLLVAVGNLYPVKGHCHLIEALSLLAAPPPARARRDRRTRRAA